MSPDQQPLLRLTQTTQGPNEYEIEIALESPSNPRRTATARFSFQLTPADEENLRWYLEEYAEWPEDPAPLRAARVEKRMGEIGEELFEKVFDSSSDARELWRAAKDQLTSTRIEVAAGVREEAGIPWELLRDPADETPLVLRAGAFVRTLPTPVESARKAGEAGPIRILLVICRPGGREDVPFRSVAVRILKGLGDEARSDLDLEVLRPPTFARLEERLKEAQAAERPFHVVHFDGHGTYAALDERYPPRLFKNIRHGPSGYLLFEAPPGPGLPGYVNGADLGSLLHETKVPVLVLNACRSAMTVSVKPDEKEEPDDGPTGDDGQASDRRLQARAWGSLAQEVMDAGVSSVVAMRYSVYVVTAAQLVADLYASLVRGRSLGEAVSVGRKELHAQPSRTVAGVTLSLQDWVVPVVYETAPIALFPWSEDEKVSLPLAADSAVPAGRGLDPDLPARPPAGFFGRDETLLALDRAFDEHSIVLLHAYAGSGKSAAAAEFARWYHLTGGVEGPVLFTSFEHYRPLAHVLDRIGQTFERNLERSGIQWLALDDKKRRAVALDLLRRVPVLWIWDNVEPVTGFPAGSETPWSAEEQEELVAFLRDAREMRAKFLLTSRRDERSWLGDLPVRISVPSMPMEERIELVRALAGRKSHRLDQIGPWRPLLIYSRGNPLTLTVVAGQALHDGLSTEEGIETFVARLRAGERAFDDEEIEGRSRSLGASLAYGFDNAFSEDERRQLALLHFFQGFIDVRVLCSMGDSEHPWWLPEVSGLTRTAGLILLDRAAEIGLLTVLGSGFYTIHPILPWFFRSLFKHAYSSREHIACRLFVETMADLGEHCHNRYGAGNRDVIAALSAEEANLLHARRLAVENGWWHCVISAIQGLRMLYDHRGRRGEWKRLLEEVVFNFLDPTTGGPLPDREEYWGRVIGYQAHLAREERRWHEAERLWQACVAWDRQRAIPMLKISPTELTREQRNAVRTLAVSLHGLGEVRRELGQQKCIEAYEESLELSERIGERIIAAACTINLGTVYKRLPGLRDLDKAERLYWRSLGLHEPHDHLGRGKCFNQLGTIPMERLLEARKRGASEDEQLHYINEAIRRYEKAIELLPADAMNSVAVAHQQLGTLYGEAGDADRAQSHYRLAIRYNEKLGDIYHAAEARFNLGYQLTKAGRCQDALEYAEEALRGYEAVGASAEADIQHARTLLDLIRQQMATSLVEG